MVLDATCSCNLFINVRIVGLSIIYCVRLFQSRIVSVLIGVGVEEHVRYF